VAPELGITTRGSTLAGLSSPPAPSTGGLRPWESEFETANEYFTIFWKESGRRIEKGPGFAPDWNKERAEEEL
jgi:hypothetical protein